MSRTSTDLPLPIDETEALRLAKECAVNQEISIGDFCFAQHTSSQRYHEQGIYLEHGSWMIYFENLSYEQEVQTLERRGTVESPGPSKHVIFQVNDQSGETNLFLLL